MSRCDRCYGTKRRACYVNIDNLVECEACATVEELLEGRDSNYSHADDTGYIFFRDAISLQNFREHYKQYFKLTLAIKVEKK